MTILPIQAIVLWLPKFNRIHFVPDFGQNWTTLNSSSKVQIWAYSRSTVWRLVIFICNRCKLYFIDVKCSLDAVHIINKIGPIKSCMRTQQAHGSMESATFESTCNRTIDPLTSPYNFFDSNSVLVRVLLPQMTSSTE